MKYIFVLIIVSYITNVYAQNYTISGYVSDVNTGEKLIGANVYDANTFKGIATNSYGFFSIIKNTKDIKLTASFVGYKPFTIKLSLTNDTLLHINLYPSSILEEVVVEASQTNKVRSSEMGTTELSMKIANKLPVIFGEADIVKTLQLTPGVQSCEAMSGMYVRGGGADQNLVLLDGVPVYNANHLFGFFSVFNSDAIKNVKLTKGAFPARYGGRLSSVLDISMKEGGNQKPGVSATIGLIALKFMINSSLSEKTSFLLSARRTYADVLAIPYLNHVEKTGGYDKYNRGYYFYDINAKVNHKFNEKHHLYLSVYTGKDKYDNIQQKSGQKVVYDDVAVPEWPHLDIKYWQTKAETQMWWSNITSALRWNYLINNKLFLNAIGTYSLYEMENYEMSGFNSTKSSLKYNSSIEDVGVKFDFDYYPSSNHSIKFGLAETYHSFEPAATVQHYNNTDPIRSKITNNQMQDAHEVAVYVEDDVSIGNRLKANVGLRWCGFKVGSVFYNNLEPRLSARILLNEQLSLKGAYAQMNQYVNLLVNSNIGLPFDLWVPATESIKPQKSQQVSIGSVYSFRNKFDFSIEGFYKKMNKLIEYKEGASFLSSGNDWQTKVTQGHGWAYGIEFLLMKCIGRTTGWIAYTLSKSERQYNKTGEEISFGQVFPYKYDRRHDISFVVSHKLNNRIDFSGTWVYGTGNATTLAYVTYPSVDQQPHSPHWEEEFNESYHPNIKYIDKRNNFRMPAYHRLDASVNFKKEKKWGQRVWNISIYNIYNRQNPFMIEWDIDPVTNEQRLMQYSLFQIIPSVSYKIEF